MAKRIHVVPNSNGGWNVEQEHAKRASVHTETKAEAVKIAKTIAKNQHEEVAIHNKNGEISDSDSFGPDPCPPIDKKH